MLRFGTDGVRGVANAELTPELALALGRAAARVLGGERFAIGRDTRRSGPLLEAALAAGLAGEGADVVSLGVAPTPEVAWWSATEAAPAAVVSASHNPFADNGIKLFSAGGRKLSDAVEEQLEAELGALLGGGGGSSHADAVGAAVGSLVVGRGRARRLRPGGHGLARGPAPRRPAGGGRLRQRLGLRGGARHPAQPGRRGPRDPRRARRRQHQRRLRVHPPRRPAGRRGRAGRRPGHRLRRRRRPGAHGRSTGGELVDGDHLIAILRHRPPRAGRADRRHRGRHRDDQPGVPPGHGRAGHPRGRDRGGRPLRARGPRPRAATRWAASRAATSSSPPWRPPATACSRPCRCSTWCCARA